MILLISAVFPPEPVVSASLVSDLAERLSTIKEVIVLTPRPSRPYGFYFRGYADKRRRFEHIVLNSFTYPKSKIIGRMYESYSFGKYAADFIKKNRSEIKCIYLNSWPLLAQYLVVKTSKKYSIPIILHVQDIYPESLSDKIPSIMGRKFIRLVLPIDKYILSNTSKVITISPKMRHFLIKSRGLEESKVEVIFNWQNEEDFISNWNLKNEEIKKIVFTFMFLGNLNRTAAIDVLISAFIKAEIENSKLVIAGNGSEKESLSALVDGNKNIEFWDAPKARVPELQEKAEVMLLNLKKGASEFALPSKLSAYMFSKKPIIACVEEVSDTANVIKEANCGWIVPPEDSEALINIMKIVVAMPEKDLLRLGKNGFNYAMRNFSKKTNLQKLTNIIIETATM